MAEMTTDSASLSAGIDLSQFYQVFFEEASENLETMEQLLLNLNVETADDEELNAIFRCAHSIKGGAATFGFSDVAELTHQMETLLDKLRRRELAPTSPMVDMLLQSGDALRAQLGRHQGSGAAAVDTSNLLISIRSFVDGQHLNDSAPRPAAAAAQTPVAAKAAAAQVGAPAKPLVRELELQVGPLTDLSLADNLVDLFKEITDLGTIEPLDGGMAADGLRRFKIVTSSTDSDLMDLFTFHVAREQVRLEPFGPGYGFHTAHPVRPSPPSNPKQTSWVTAFLTTPPAHPPAWRPAAPN
ncbi:Hpt domain-containing protein [Roseateles sp. GG27B]